MTKKPIIGISANEVEDSGEKLHNLPINYLPAGYVRGVQLAGGLPILLPIGTKEDAIEYVTQIDKLVLTGGQNVNPKWYQEELSFDASLMSTKRDEFELALINETMRQKKPIFAVCRGLQLINVALGGTLHQDLSQRTPEPVIHMQDPIPREEPTHKIRTEEGSSLRQIYGENTSVNSFHFQSIKELAPSLKVAAISEDNIIEGIESNSTISPILGVQWHPDFAYEAMEQEREIFKFVVNEL
ncbi:gamma-glutamyl-gamma-aminobutyrate hydrolase family protein [Vagococcus carniphilus]|uniref:gamma-glutamyl-gamma-aminobutyrate hydrolase family protein n=1 Tax=Vagococcus carniphilus TaxID=218144 RepID=UPI00288CC7AD|nr:gamma-glutamyl-gamma-aminobutyrate hydrolase family protein [Vagococcus carniphilus]MDT2815500.1 gamma-glutamyl-gamma-aminobutyrate hydrolase family protein [Vagococcus carniphilus]MDT2829542.1 gamma-glutamyl-gamma-aminobutyrate hydrolase family protein [Vagococcus carniphilus]MDT2839001.1 gamma-glutamyl-gamma-aminobutyrate hydrolase family protein [Vagococcus carniphilus]MDT2853059.1 gamma-glutamyl-gamma-aminobutyrate hydrolase family protein [Vagococcus carniphilus]MDT2864608.1 gamma-glut